MVKRESKAKQRRDMLRRVMSLVLAFALVLGSLPVTAVFASEQPALYGEGLGGAENIDSLAASPMGGDELSEFIASERRNALNAISANRELTGLVGFEGINALASDDTLVNVIVVFESNPVGVQLFEAEIEGVFLSEAEAELIVEREHALFNRELFELFELPYGIMPLFPPFVITQEFRLAINGVALTIPSNQVAALAEFESVLAVYPDEMIFLDPINVELLMAGAEPFVNALSEETSRNPLGVRTGREAMNAGQMHDLGYRGRGVLIAVIDTGIDYNHPAFLGAFPTLEYMHNVRGATHLTEADTIWLDGGYIFCNEAGGTVYIEGGYFYVGRDLVTQAGRANPNPASPMETRPGQFIHDGQPVTGQMHGTHVAGIAAARDSGGAVSALGIAPQASLVVYRTLAPGALTSDSVAAVERTALDNADILNNSWGGGSDPSGPTVMAVNNIVVSHGIIVTNAAGNDGPGFMTSSPPAYASLGINVGNFFVEGAMGLTFVGGGVTSEITAFQGHFVEFWQEYGDTGRYISSHSNAEHDNGFMRIIPMPVSSGSPANPGNEGVPVGSGNAADFALLDANFTPEELEGAFVIVRRGHGFADVGTAAAARGMAGAISVNQPGGAMITPVAPGQVGTDGDFQFFMINNADGAALANYLTTAGGTTVGGVTPFSMEGLHGALPFAVVSGSSRGPVRQTFEIAPMIGAIGTSVLSPVPTWTVGNQLGDFEGAYSRAGGTSMSAPAIAGAAALLLQAGGGVQTHTVTFDGNLGTIFPPQTLPPSAENPNATAAERWNWSYWEVRARLMNTAFDVATIYTGAGAYLPQASVFEQGAGHVDVYAAYRAETVIYTYYPRVATAPGVFDGVTKAGAFSFGPVSVGLSRTVDARIVGAPVDNIRYEFNTDTRNAGTGATMALTSIGADGSFSATITLPADGENLYFEGFIIAERGGQTVARVPFAAVGAGPPPDAIVQDVQLARPVVTTGEYRHLPQSNTLTVFFEALYSIAMEFDVFVYEMVNGAPVPVGGGDGFMHTTQQVIPVMHGSIDRLRHNMISFGEAFLPGHDEPDGGEFGTLPPGPALEEGEYLLRLKVYGLWPGIDERHLFQDLEFPFFVDNTPPEIETLTIEANGFTGDVDLLDNEDGVVVRPDIDFNTINQITITGNVNDLWLEQAIARGDTFDIWLPTSSNNEASIPSNLAVYALIGPLDYDPPAPGDAVPEAVRNEPPVRVVPDADGNFTLDLDVTGLLDWDVNIWVVDGYSPTPRLRNEIGQTTSWFEITHETFNPAWAKFVDDNTGIQLGRLAGWTFNTAHTAPMSQNVWLGGNVLAFNVMVAPYLQAVEDITMPVNELFTGVPLPLNQHAAVVPANATRRTITWELVSVNGATGASAVPAFAPAFAPLSLTEPMSFFTEADLLFTDEQRAALEEDFTELMEYHLPMSPMAAALEEFEYAEAFSQAIGDVTLSPAGILVANEPGAVVVRARVVDGLLGGSDFTKEFTINVIAPVLTAREHIGIWRPVISGQASPPGVNLGANDIREWPIAGSVAGVLLLSRSNLSPVTFGFDGPAGLSRDVFFFVGEYGSALEDALLSAEFNNVSANQSFFNAHLVNPFPGGTHVGISGIAGVLGITPGTADQLEEGEYTLWMVVDNPGGQDVVESFTFIVTNERPEIVFDETLFEYEHGDTHVAITGRVNSFGQELAVQHGLRAMNASIDNINLTPANTSVFDFANGTWFRGPATVPVNPDGTFSFDRPVSAPSVTVPVSVNTLVNDGKGWGIINTTAAGSPWVNYAFSGANRSLATPFTYQMRPVPPEPVTDIEFDVASWFIGLPLDLNANATVVPAWAYNTEIDWEIVSVTLNGGGGTASFVAPAINPDAPMIESVPFEGFEEFSEFYGEQMVTGPRTAVEQFVSDPVSAGIGTLDVETFDNQVAGDATLTPAGLLTVTEEATVVVRATIENADGAGCEFDKEFTIEIVPPRPLTAHPDSLIWRPILSSWVNTTENDAEPDPRAFGIVRPLPPQLLFPGDSLLTRSNYSSLDFGFIDPEGRTTPRTVRLFHGPYGTEFENQTHFANLPNMAPGNLGEFANTVRVVKGGETWGVQNNPDLIIIEDGTTLTPGVHVLTVVVENIPGQPQFDLREEFHFVVAERPEIEFDNNGEFSFDGGDTHVTITGQVNSGGHTLATQNNLYHFPPAEPFWTPTPFDHSHIQLQRIDGTTAITLDADMNADGKFSFELPVSLVNSSPAAFNVRAIDGRGLVLVGVTHQMSASNISEIVEFTVTKNIAGTTGFGFEPLGAPVEEAPDDYDPDYVQDYDPIDDLVDDPIDDDPIDDDPVLPPFATTAAFVGTSVLGGAATLPFAAAAVPRANVVTATANRVTIQIQHGGTVGASMPTAQRNDFVFLGWNTQPDGQGTAFTATTPVTESITVYAVWGPPGPPEPPIGPPIVTPPVDPVDPEEPEDVEEPEEVEEPGEVEEPVQPTPDPDPAPPNFVDVPEGSWYEDYVNTATGLGLFRGTEEGVFSPYLEITRAMFVQVIARLLGTDTSVFAFGAGSFGDVLPDAWYFEAVEWSAAAGIVTGVGGGNFAPNDPITREQMAVMLFRFILTAGIQLPANLPPMPPFADQASISVWAAEAVELMLTLGIMQGRPDGTFDPQATATRAEAAAVFTRFFEAFLQ